MGRISSDGFRALQPQDHLFIPAAVLSNLAVAGERLRKKRAAGGLKVPGDIDIEGGYTFWRDEKGYWAVVPGGYAIYLEEKD